MKMIFFDESGYSGPNLLDPKSPFYACASIYLTEEEARELKEKYFPNKQTELKFAGMESGRNFHKSKELVSELLERHAIQVTVIDKKFALCAKIFEIIAEPSMSRSGIDLYSNGMMPQMVSLFYQFCTQFQPNELGELLGTFQSVVRRENTKTLDDLVGALENLNHQLIANFSQGVLLRALNEGGEELFEDDDITEGLLGILLSASYQNLLRWDRRLGFANGSELKVIHDNHSVLEAEIKLWQQFTSCKISMRANGIDYSLSQPVDTELGDSKRYIGIQIADLVAGFTCFAVEELIHQQLGDFSKRHPKQNGLDAFAVFLNSQFEDDDALVIVTGRNPEQFTGWSVS